MANGKLTFVKSAACSNGPPKGGVWFPVSVTVHGQDVQVYHSGVLVASIKSHFAPRAWGGVFTFHGYKNVVLFRKFKIAPQTYITKRCKKVVWNICDTKAVFDASLWHSKKLTLSNDFVLQRILRLCFTRFQSHLTRSLYVHYSRIPISPTLTLGISRFPIMWTKLNLPITSLHQSKPEIPPPLRFFEPSES